MSVSNRYIRFACSLLLTCVLIQTAYSESVLKIEFPEGPLPGDAVALRQSGDLLYIDLKGFADALNIRTYINDEKGKIQYYVSAARIIWTAGNSFVILGDRIIQLPAEVTVHEGIYWAPLDAFLDIISTAYPADLQYDRYLWTIRIRPTAFDAYSLIYDVKDNGTLIRIPCTRKFDISGAALRKKNLSLTLMNASVNLPAFKMTEPAGAVKELIIEELPESVQLTFILDQEPLEHTVWQEENPHQIVISLVTSRISPEDEPDIASGIEDDISQLLVNEQERWKFDCVVIDPGHGGKDAGATGVTGLKEKTVVLDIAKRLQELLQKETDIEVLLTRDEDQFIGLNDRTKFANQAGGKLFISIHCNSSNYKSAHGFETYFLKPARNERAMEVALKENSVIQYEASKSQYQDLTEENYILLAMAQAEFARESEALAAIVQRNTRVATQLHDRGVDQAGFYVLVGASMPAILFEAPFLSNKREEKLLKQKKFRQQIAEALYKSIIEFRDLEKQKNQGLSSSP